MLRRFWGGVRPDGRKRETGALHSAFMEPAPRRVALWVETPLVSVGDQVEVGTLLSEAIGPHPAVHASVSGTVAAVEPRLRMDGAEALSVVIESDGLDTSAKPGPRVPAEALPASLERGDIIAAARRAGVDDGKGVDAAYLLERAMGKADTVILNGAESEPYVSADHRLLLERTADVLTGARLLARALGLERVVVAVQGDKYNGINALRALLPLRGGDVEVKVLRTRYPQGADGPLVRAVTGRKTPHGGAALDVNCAVFGLRTAADLCAAVYEGLPVTRRIVTVTGRAVRNAQNLWVPLGTGVDEIFEACGGWAEHPERVLAGGGMAGLTLTDLDVPLDRTIPALVAMTRKEAKLALRPEGECLRCGRCIEVCPQRLEPVTLRLYADAERWEAVERLHIEDCDECGACAYACPARRKLVETIRRAKAQSKTGGKEEGLDETARDAENPA